MLIRRLSSLYIPFIASIGLMPFSSNAEPANSILTKGDSSVIATTQSQQTERKYGIPKKQTGYTTFDSSYSYIGHQIIDSTRQSTQTKHKH